MESVWLAEEARTEPWQAGPPRNFTMGPSASAASPAPLVQHVNVVHSSKWFFNVRLERGSFSVTENSTTYLPWTVVPHVMISQNTDRVSCATESSIASGGHRLTLEPAHARPQRNSGGQTKSMIRNGLFSVKSAGRRRDTPHHVAPRAW